MSREEARRLGENRKENLNYGIYGCLGGRRKKNGISLFDYG